MTVLPDPELDGEKEAEYQVFSIKLTRVMLVAVAAAAPSEVALAAENGDGIAFLHANCAPHARIAAVSPNTRLSSIYVGLLDVIEAHTLAVVPATRRPLGQSPAERYRQYARPVRRMTTKTARRE